MLKGGLNSIFLQTWLSSLRMTEQSTISVWKAWNQIWNLKLEICATANHQESITTCKLSVYLLSVTSRQLHFLSTDPLISTFCSWCRNQRRNCWARRIAPVTSLARSYSAISIFLGSAFFLPPHHPWHHILHTDASPISYLLQSSTRRSALGGWIC